MTPIRFNLKVYRTKNNMTQEEISTRIGVSQAMISQYERNWRSVKNSTIQQIAKALDIDPLELYMDDNGTSLKDLKCNVDFYPDDYDL